MNNPNSQARRVFEKLNKTNKTTQELEALAKKLIPDNLFSLHTIPTTPEQEAAIKMATTDIVERFGNATLYSKPEQDTINQAIAILASKLVSQDTAFLMTSTSAVKDFLQLKLATNSREVFAVMFLNTENRLIKYDEMFAGTIDSSVVYIREILTRALSLNAKNIIVVHNHPSGVLEASIADDRITDRIDKAAQVMDIKLLDHIIVSERGTFSYAEHGKMPF